MGRKIDRGEALPPKSMSMVIVGDQGTAAGTVRSGLETGQDI